MEEKKELMENTPDLKMNRAQRRQLIFPNGYRAPKRPFNNRKRNKGTRPLELKKEKIYEQLKSRRAA
jgi:hypothetical protein